MNSASRLLVVEYEEQVRSLLQKVLARSGYTVHTVQTAEEAIEVLGTSMRFDAVISENSLPGMDGHELARQLSARSPGTKMIFVSANKVECGACPHVPKCPQIGKPFVPKELVQKVSEVLGSSPEKSN